MKALALIAMTRPYTIGRALESARLLGWETLGLSDFQKSGPGTTQNRLLRAAAALGAEYVKIADDDDQFLAPPETLLREIGDADLLTHGGEIWTRGKLHSICDGTPRYPWQLFGRTESLMRVCGGKPWNEERKSGCGQALFLNLLMHAPKLAWRQSPMIGYRWFFNERPDQISYVDGL
jgi:hypothetical protein